MKYFVNGFLSKYKPFSPKLSITQLPKPPISSLALSGMGTSLMYLLEYQNEHRVTIGMELLIFLIRPLEVFLLPRK